MKKYANDPALLARAAKQLSDNKPEAKKAAAKEPEESDGELSETSLKSDDENGSDQE